jgi:hypothetical protein
MKKPYFAYFRYYNTSVELIEADSLEEAESHAWELAVDYAESYGAYQCPDSGDFVDEDDVPTGHYPASWAVEASLETLEKANGNRCGGSGSFLVDLADLGYYKEEAAKYEEEQRLAKIARIDYELERLISDKEVIQKRINNLIQERKNV